MHTFGRKKKYISKIHKECSRVQGKDIRAAKGKKMINCARVGGEM